MSVVGGAGGLSLVVRASSWDIRRNPSPPPSQNNKVGVGTITLNPTTKKNKSTPTPKPKPKPKPKQDENDEELYMGYERWLPAPPPPELLKTTNPKSIYNAASLAYLGDCIYELYARRQFLFPPLNIDEYNQRVMAVVRCEAQDAMLKKLLYEDYLSEEERDILRWGKNVNSGKTRTVKRAGVAVYSRASSLETLVGYLYLTDVNRLEDIMLKLGFSTSVPGSHLTGLS